ncbi:proline hydroxylase [Pseudoxanthomonas broegbernensis]|uniref:Proline hydroxylase n=1 Tax=Pseudoxanthomonas broegbernensis TaxID=83619 RepID=A0A7V8K822_9GAMM|nr:2OG-Fe(II) oxygenase [Pseudoxanthomonas broegbernensis]KAF1687206.1 proline hydroxylase [Pseudoxanthomonas broegbernensis]MBB6065809.1 Rps23 Pro-64 3,4-dihydroxylase Tpa1-like proline 4-hydroxylase [Pseudoxanthomonas broegbernensis]
MLLTRLDALEARVADDAAAYAGADPFPHIVIDGLLNPTALEQAMREFPAPQAIEDWRRADAVDAQGRVAQKLKLGYSDELRFGPTLRALVHELHSSPFLRYLERLTGIERLLPDAHMTGGGLHQYLPGAVLRMHADFNKLPGFELDRRLNLLVYLNPAWDPAWGGDLELWDRGMKACVQRIAPLSNRCVVFSTTHDSFHGMPDPLACPDGVTRRSLALYYYSNGRPEAERRGEHSTLWQARPGEA